MWSFPIHYYHHPLKKTGPRYEQVMQKGGSSPPSQDRIDGDFQPGPTRISSDYLTVCHGKWWHVCGFSACLMWPFQNCMAMHGDSKPGGFDQQPIFGSTLAIRHGPTPKKTQTEMIRTTSSIAFITLWEQILHQHMNHATKSRIAWSVFNLIAFNGALQTTWIELDK